jgi:toxin ParE1/3/4
MNSFIRVRARLDLKKYWRWIAVDNREAADRFLEAAEQTFGAIAKNPDLGSQRSFRKLANIRSRAVLGFPNYLIFYQTRADAVVVLRVLHGMRDLPRFFRARRR